MLSKKRTQHTVGYIFSLFFILVGCSGPEYNNTYYKAISLDKRDTALLRIEASADAFHGDYQIRYDDKSMDDGTITGAVNGDTLLGKFVYLSRDNVRSVHPIAFLKSGDKMKLGIGIAGTYMGFHVYQRGSLAFGDSLFQFQPITKEELASLKQKGK